MSNWLGRRMRSWWFWLGMLAVAIVGVQGHAWLQFRAARQALDENRSDLAQQHLKRCKAVWPWNQRADVHILLARADRQSGDLDAAMSALRRARELVGSTTPELAFEWALLQAADGNVADVADYLQVQAEALPALQRDVWDALATGYLAVYRFNDAYTVAQLWLNRMPNDLRALELRGLSAIQGRGRGLKLGVDDLRNVLKRQPHRDVTRQTLAVALLELGEFSEALPEWEMLVEHQPDDVNHQVRLARCLKMMNRTDEAVTRLDAVLQADPDNGLALRTRGQFALAEQQQTEAERWLRRAAEVLPNDYQTQYLFYQALALAGQSLEAAEQLKRSEVVKQQSLQISDLKSRRLAERPLDPALYTEMGSLLLQRGNNEPALRWLDVALSLDPNFRPAHSVLAEYYEKTGQTDRAASHRRMALPPNAK